MRTQAKNPVRKKPEAGSAGHTEAIRACMGAMSRHNMTGRSSWPQRIRWCKGVRMFSCLSETVFGGRGQDPFNPGLVRAPGKPRRKACIVLLHQFIARSAKERGKT